ncbi:hypothetical protein IKF02_00185 [Candidatus Saccharibacteria bacterium]|nr:hypothetical protein [Candidatus Saccharibacteria bacterium]
MKSFLKKIIVLVAVILSVSFATSLTSPTPTYARDMGSCEYVLGLTSWDCGIEEKPDDTEKLKSNIVIIASNVLVDISVIATYLVLGYVIYGGYLYVFSSGDPSKVSAGKKTLTHAFTGLAIVILANVILNTIRITLLGANGSFSDVTGTNAKDMVTGMISWAISIAGVVSLIFIVIGGVNYTTSAGDPSKIQKAKQTILYALIGLAIVALAEIITAVVSSTIRDAAAFNNETLIAKELYEK